MQIAVVGTGYVGLVLGVCFANIGHKVYCVDVDENKIENLKKGIIPIFEKGLEELLAKSKENIEFTSNLKESLDKVDIVFVAVGTPEKEDGSANMEPTWRVIEDICNFATSKKYIVLKSTVPVGTAKEVQQYCGAHSSQNLEVINNPEFLREGNAVKDLMCPSRIVVGCSSEEAKAIMSKVYTHFLEQGHSMYFMSNASAEITKYAANSFLAVKISFINELALLADNFGADIEDIKKGFTSDKRINPAFFNPGVGFGGSCFPKDVKALVYTAEKNNLTMDVVRAADIVNKRQRNILIEKATNHFKDLSGKTFAIWGLSFKPETDDVRESAALYMVEALVGKGAKVQGYDPIAGANFFDSCKYPFVLKDTPEAALENADALFVVTDWQVFKEFDLGKIKNILKNSVVFDGRNIFDPLKMKVLGFAYYCLGRENI